MIYNIILGRLQVSCSLYYLLGLLTSKPLDNHKMLLFKNILKFTDAFDNNIIIINR